MTLRTAATSLFSIIGFILLTMAAGLISANVRKLADRHGWDNFLTRSWDHLAQNKLAQKWLDKLPHWERLQRFWWLWFMFGATGGVAGALWLTAIPPKSAFLGLDDSQKWRFSESFRSAAVENGAPISCEFALGVSRTVPSEFNFVWGVWTELEPMLDLASWTHTPSGDLGLDHHRFPPGFTILTGTHKGPAFICATELGRILQATLAPGTPVRSDQVTEALTGCQNNCVELDIGDFRVR
jgi:hypothetical protein